MPTSEPIEWAEYWYPLRKDDEGRVIVPTQDAITAELDKLDVLTRHEDRHDQVNRMDPRR